MVLTCTTSGDNTRLLVRSDLTDPIAARREVEHWAVEHGIRVPRMALRLRVVDDAGTVHEWTVLDAPEAVEPPPAPPTTPNRFGIRANERRKEARNPLPDFIKVLTSQLFAA